MCAGIIGMTAAVASSALVFYSIMDFSKQASIGPSFLLHDSGGAKGDNTCLPASGPWPTNSVSQDEELGHLQSDGSYVTCYSFQGGENHCWSHSYYVDGDWKQCTPNGSGWSVYSPSDDTYASGDFGVSGHTTITLSAVATCGGGCTEFSSDVPH